LHAEALIAITFTMAEKCVLSQVTQKPLPTFTLFHCRMSKV